MRRRLTMVSIVAMLLSACSGPETESNDNNTTGSMGMSDAGEEDVSDIASRNNSRTHGSDTNSSTNAGGTNSWTGGGVACGAIGFDDSTGERQFYDCSGAEGDLECDCDGEMRTSDATECEDALRAECGVDDRELEACRPTSGAVCWDAGDGSYQCQCAEGAALIDADGEYCGGAGWLACSSSCTVDGTDCAPTVTDDGTAFTCDCAYYDVTRTKYVTEDTDCERAVKLLCEPGSFLDGCTGWKGFCNQVTQPEFGFDCTCLDDSTRFVTPAELDGVDDCERAMVLACGDNTPPDGYYCEAEVDNVRGECTRSTGDQGQVVFECMCTEDMGAMNASAGSQTVETDDCETALMTACNL